ncbi:hypothetical protein ScalyP_jg11668 [Parmales sp. scaly parma]|nr:hypothetical protein ScalyP_jg11668 [Parmales sp. scaly parma]
MNAKAVTHGARLILDEKNARKKAEENSQLLSNRIQHLKDEVQRAARRAKEATSRAKEITTLKVKAKERRDLAKTVNKRVEKLQLKEEGLFGTWVPGGKHMKTETTDGMDAKEIKAVILKREQDIIAANKKKIEDIKKQQAEQVRKKKEVEEKRLKQLKEQFKRKMVAEKRKREEAESVVMKLEEEEEKLIEMLRQTQEVQTVAYEKLQEAIIVNDEN